MEPTATLLLHCADRKGLVFGIARSSCYMAETSCTQTSTRIPFWGSSSCA